MKNSKIFNRINRLYVRGGQALGVAFSTPSARQSQALLFVIGVGLLAAGLSDGATAQGLATRYNDVRLVNSLNAIFTYIEGAFGALVMVSAGIGAILSSAFGQYRAAMGLLVVAVGAFILRSILATFFNDNGIRS